VKSEYKPGVFEDFFMQSFRNKLVEFMKVWTFCIQGAKRVFFFFAHVEARVSVLTCQWLMGPCKVNTIDLPNGEAWENGVMILLIEVGIQVGSCGEMSVSRGEQMCGSMHQYCKLPTQVFFCNPTQPVLIVMS
ncbi:hypothetical protein HID58_083875, partial [Brassica napus]